QRIAHDRSGEHLVDARHLALDHERKLARHFVNRVNPDLWHFQMDAIARELGQRTRGPPVADVDQLGQRVLLYPRQFHAAPRSITLASTAASSFELTGFVTNA